jgi:hypothetical protein
VNDGALLSFVRVSALIKIEQSNAENVLLYWQFSLLVQDSKPQRH